MKTALIGAAMLTVLTASVSYAGIQPGGASRDAAAGVAGEGAAGGRGVRLASAAAGTFLFVPDAVQSPLVAVGEGGEGRKGRRFRAYRYSGPYYGRSYRRYRAPYYARPYYAPPPYSYRRFYP